MLNATMDSDFLSPAPAGLQKRSLSSMMPAVVLCNAVSLDGHTGGFAADREQFYGVAQTVGEDATLVGCDTLLAATDPDFVAPAPLPKAADSDDPRPILVAVDSRGRIKDWPYWQAQPHWRKCISICTEETPSAHIQDLHRLGVTPLTAGGGRADLARALKALGRDHGVWKVRVESGGRLNGALLAAGLVAEVHLLVHPVLVGETGAAEFSRGLGLPNGLALRLNGVERKPDDLLLLSYAVVPAP